MQIFKPAGQAHRFNIAVQAATAVATYGLMDANVDVREAAKTSLRLMGKDTTIKVLMDCIASSSDDEVKINFAEATVAVLGSAPLQKDGGAHSTRCSGCAELSKAGGSSTA